MESPKTYHGYDKDGKCITTKTGEDANGYINPADVKTAIDNLENVLNEQFKGVAQALRDVIVDANEAVIVEGTKMGGTIEETSSAIENIPGQIMGDIKGLYDVAVKAHDEIQIRLNEEAKNKCWGNGVESVS